MDKKMTINGVEVEFREELKLVYIGWKRRFVFTQDTALQLAAAIIRYCLKEFEAKETKSLSASINAEISSTMLLLSDKNDGDVHLVEYEFHNLVDFLCNVPPEPEPAKEDDLEEISALEAAMRGVFAKMKKLAEKAE